MRGEFFFSEFILQAYSFEFVGEEGCVLLSDGQYGGAVCQADLCAAEASHFVLCYHVGAVDADELFGGQCALHGFHVGAGEHVGAVGADDFHVVAQGFDVDDVGEAYAHVGIFLLHDDALLLLG